MDTADGDTSSPRTATTPAQSIRSPEAAHRPHRLRVGRIAARSLAVVGLCVVAVHALGADGNPRWARPGDLRVSLELLDRTVSAFEPVIARVTVTNSAAEQVKFSLAPMTYTPDTYLEIRDSRGKVVAATPRPQRQGGPIDVITPGYTLGPGKSRSKFWALSALYTFKEPGEFSIHLQLLSPTEGGERAVTSQDKATLRVLPFDAARLEARCEDILRPARTHEGFGDLEIGARTKILYSVRHDIVLPYLDWMVREWSSTYACWAMRRIGTERAKKLLQALMARPGSIGREAKSSLKLPLDLGMWAVVLD